MGDVEGAIYHELPNAIAAMAQAVCVLEAERDELKLTLKHVQAVRSPWTRRGTVLDLVDIQPLVPMSHAAGIFRFGRIRAVWVVFFCCVA